MCWLIIGKYQDTNTHSGQPGSNFEGEIDNGQRVHVPGYDILPAVTIARLRRHK